MSASSRSARARVAVVALALLCAAAGFVVGRRMAAAPARGPSYLEQLTEQLDLRPDQVAALEAVLSEEDRELDALLHRELEGLRAETEARRVRTEQQLLALLDASQRERYDALVAAEAPR